MTRTPDPLDRRWFAVSAEEYDRIQAELAEPPKVLPRLAALLAESSFGTTEATALRATVSDERVERVMERVRELDAERDNLPTDGGAA